MVKGPSQAEKSGPRRPRRVGRGGWLRQRGRPRQKRPQARFRKPPAGSGALAIRLRMRAHTTAYESARGLTWAAEEDLLFEALGADFDISVRGLGGALGRSPDRPVSPDYRHGK